MLGQLPIPGEQDRGYVNWSGAFGLALLGPYGWAGARNTGGHSSL